MALALNLMIANLYVRFAVDGEETWDSNVRSLRAITGAQGLTLDIYPDRKPKVSILFIGFFIFFRLLAGGHVAQRLIATCHGDPRICV
jgi:hypothetical protein